MRKMITTLLVMAIVMLSAFPVQAQTVARKQTTMKEKTMKPMKPAKLSMTAQLEKTRAQKKAKAHPKAEKALKTKAPLRLVTSSNGEVKDEHGIITTPAEGIRNVYSRSGGMYINENGIQDLEQNGNIHIVECEDGTVYIRNILASYPTGAWVKGVRKGNTITVTTRQPIFYNAQANVTYSFGWGFCEMSWGSYSFSYYGGETATFSVDDEAKTISLDMQMEGLFLGLFWDDDDAFANFGDYNTVWTYNGEYQPMQTVEVSAPAAEAETWYIRAHKTVNDERQVVKGSVDVVISGSDIYLKGVFGKFANGWMKGTADSNGLVTFDGLQLQGNENGQPVYAVGAAMGDLQPFQMTFDAKQKELKSTVSLLANKSTTDIATDDSYDDITITATDPFAPIDTLPYTNAIGSEDDFEWFTVIDANEDGRTWQLFDEDGVWKASLRYDSDNAANDWLISPAFKLEAGKTYTMSIDMNGSSEYNTERFEVKMGNAATAEAMTQEVIAATEINSVVAATYQNKLVSVGETGIYHFGIHGISDPDMASLRASNFKVAETILGAPEAVSNLVVSANDELSQVVISFTAPTKNVGGEDLTESLSIDITRDGECITTLSSVIPGSTQSFTDENVESGKHIYTVVPANAAGRGEATSQTATISSIYDIPFTGDFSEEGTYNLFTTINANDDGAYWSDNGFYAAYEYSSDNDADDYLVTPGLRLEAGKRYNIVVEAEAAGEYTERFEVVMGKEATAEGLTNKVIEPVEIIGSDGRMTYESVFTCEESGIYYASVHCISDADMYALWIFKLNVENAPALTAPAAPELNVIANDRGEKSASFIVKAPATDINGDALTANLDSIQILRDNQVIMTVKDVAPNSNISDLDVLEESGIYTYQAIPYNSDGIGMKSPKVKVFVGIDVPADVTGVKASDQKDKVLLTWDKVGEKGANGGYVDPANVTYKIYACEPNSTWVMSEDPVATVKDADSYMLDYNPNEGEQGYQMWAVVASNESGESSIEKANATLTVGKPYDLPMVEGFTNGGFHYYCDYVGVPLVFSQSSDDDGAALALASQQENSLVAFTTGKVNIAGTQHPTLFVDAASFGADNFMIVASKNGDTDNAMVLAKNISIDNTGFNTIKVSLEQLKDADYVMLGFMAHINNATVFDEWTGEIEEEGDAFILDNIRIVDLCDSNLGIEVVTASELQAGRTTSVMAKVTNWSEKAAKNYTVTIKAGEKVLSKKTITETLMPFKSKILTALLETSVLDEEGEQTVTATVEFAGDEKAEDNYAETIVNIVAPIAPAPESLVAQDKGEAGVDLSWNAPTTTAVLTEDFENGFGGWTSIDSDGDGYNWKLSNYGSSDASMDTHSGLNAVYSESFSNAESKALTPDNWLVSPKVVLDGTFSFYAKGQDPDWCNEHFAIFVSTGDPTDLNSFTQISEELVADDVMSEYSIDLTSYAGQMGYVAIRHFNSSDMYVLVVDDITYTMGGQPSKYNIYYEDALIASIEGNTTTYTVAAEKLEFGEHTFAVSAVYGNGQESKPTTATITVTVDIKQIAADGSPVDIYSIDGKLIRRQATSLKGLKGMFVANGKTIILK